MRVLQNGFANNVGLVGKSLRRYLTTTALTATGLMALTTPSFADNWTDHVASEGSISIDTSVANTTNITQHTDFTKVQGDGDINAGWTVNVAQPSSSSKYVLYDIENDPTHILGALNANGQIYIFDQNGVIFGRDSQVNVGSIVTSTGYISDADIKADQLKFVDVGGNGNAGNIELNGSITVADAGLAAFVAPGVKNAGVINAKMGKVALASGDKVTLDLYGDGLVEIAADDALENAIVENSGTITAEGGTVALTAQAAKGAVDSVINMDGVVDVSSVSVKGGKIILGGGNKGVVKVAGKLKADGATGGGEVKVTGENIHATETSEISASALTLGDGGTVDLIAQNGLVYGGSILAKGGVLGGKGGAVDTSGLGWVAIDGLVDVSAQSGLHGTWLIDPSNLTITDFFLASTNVGGNGSAGSPFKPDGDTISVLKTSSIQSALNTGANVFITTVGTPNKTLQDGTITIDANITKSSGAESTLNFEAAGGIILNAGKTISASAGRVLNVVMHALGSNILVPGVVINGAINTNGGFVDIDSDVGNIVVGNNGAINTNGGNINMNADFLIPTALLGNPLTGGTVINGVVDAQGGNVNIHQSGMFKGDANSVRTSDNGSITLNQNSLLGQGGTIQNAIDAIDNTGIGTNTVNVGIGTYNEAVVADVNNLVLNGAWAGINPLLRLIVPSLLETVIDPNSPGIHITADNVTVDGFTVTGATGGDGYGIWVDGADNATIKNNKITDTDQAGIYASGFSKNVVITDNQINDARNGGIVLNGVWGSTTARNFIDNIRNIAGIFIGDSIGDNYITSNFIGLGGTGTGVNDIWGDGIEVYQVNGVQIQSNVITNTWDPTKNNTNDNSSGIYLRKANDTIVGGPGLLDGNLIYNVDWDGVKVSGGSNNLVQGNVISDTTRIGIYGDYDMATSFLTIDKNIVSNANLDKLGVITVMGGNDHTITNNIVTSPTGMADAGIWLQGAWTGQNLIEGNVVHDVRGTGIEVLNVGDVDIKRNIITKTSRADDALNGDGIRLRDSVGDLNIVGNIIGDILNLSKIEGDGIKISGANNVKIKSNVISNTQSSDPVTGDDASGIYLYQVNGTQVGGPDLLDANIITNANWDGVKIAGGTGNVVQGNLITSSTRIGVYGESANDVTVKNNIVHDSNLPIFGGITLLGGGSHEVIENFVTNDDASTGWAGIYLAGNSGHNEISDNWVYNFSHQGVHVWGTAGTIEIDNNKIGTVDTGIYAGNAQGLKITDNIIDGRFLEAGKGSYGILVEDSYNAQIGGPLFSETNYVEDFNTGIRVKDSNSADVEGNIVNAFVDNGIHVTDSRYVDVKENIVFNGDGNGILVEDSNDAEINENFVTLVGGHGIQLVDSDRVDIMDNIVTLVGRHGIFVDPSDFVDIAHNFIHFTGWDGINLTFGNWGDIWDNHIGFTGGDGIDVYDNDYVNIWDNRIHNTADNGIEVSNSTAADIKYNRIHLTGGDGIQVRGSLFADVIANRIRMTGDDGIDVEDSAFADINFNNVRYTAANGIEVSDSFDADIIGNRVRNTLRDGISVVDSDFADIRDNLIRYTGDDGIDVRSSQGVDIVNNRIHYTIGDGIQARWSAFLDVIGNRVRFAGDDGIDVENTFWSRINDNNVRFSDNNGIEVEDSLFVLIDGNTSNDNGDAGIFVDPSNFITVSGNTANDNTYGIQLDAVDHARILGNTIRNNLIGLFASGPDNGDIEVSGNTFDNNEIGAEFQSGNIDLTGAGNTFIAGTNGKIGLRFAPFDIGKGLFAQLTLVNDGNPAYGGTIGAQTFTGYTDPGDYYVELDNEAFFAPGNPTLLNGLNSTYDGLLPALTGGVLTQAQFDILESRFFHYPDGQLIAENLGLFWFGFVETPLLANINQKDLFNIFDQFNGDATGLNVRITGLPRLPGQQGLGGGNLGQSLNNIQTFAGGQGTSPEELNNIETAAGDNDQRGNQQSAGGLNDIETAAGGGEDTSCWSDAVSIAGSGQSVNVVYGGSMADNLNQAASCGTSF